MSFWGDTGGFLDSDADINFVDEEGIATTASWELGRDGLIFLIDVTKPMFQKSRDTDEFFFEICLKCIHNVLMSKIVSSDKDVVGVIFFGTENCKNPSDFQHVYIFQDLDMPDPNRILQVEALQKEEMLLNFSTDYGHSLDFALSDALWSCSSMFASCPYKLGQKRVLIFTNTDDPHANNKELKKRAKMKGTDLCDLGIGVELLHMKPGSGIFNVNLFYRDLINEDEIDMIVDPAEKFDELMTRVRMKEYKKRAITRLPFQLAEGLSFGVSIYSLNRQATKGSYVKVDSRTNEEVKCVTKYICQDTGQELLPTDIKLYQEFGGVRVVYEKEEIDQMKDLLKPGFHLIGFKPRKYLKIYYHVRPASFIYPDESSVTGSSSLFTALLTRCIVKDVMPVCVVVTRRSTPPRFVVLLPQEEETDEHQVQLKPPGFHIIYLPYSDDIRKLKIESHSKASDEQIDKMKEIIDKLKFKYTADMFENPSIQKFYRSLEAFALDRDEVENFNDLTIPNTDLIEKKAGMLMKELKELVFPEGYENTSSAGKRKAPSSGDSASKKPKPDLVDINMEEVAKKGNLNKLTVTVLKTFCQANKIKSGTQKKADLIEAIKEHFGV